MNYTVKQLCRLSVDERDTLMASAPLPDPALMRGRTTGTVFSDRLPLALKLWRGKTFRDDGQGGACGKNLLGVGLAQLAALRFHIEAGDSKFHNRKILLINHDLPGNPAGVRAYHDELVAVSERLCLAASYLPYRGELRFICHFTLLFAQPVRQ